ncbi:MAG: LytR family transcriptional regulator, partial [Erysipelotrichaceae bacterium]|nr:LytR family transcriptional regulator [Erysipelotrichaceae bacterium]
MKKTFIKILLFLLFLIGAISLGSRFFLNSMLTKVEQGEVITEEDSYISKEVLEKKASKPRRVENFLLFGVDNSIPTTNKFNEERSDAMKIISLDYDNKKVKITSVERDLVVWAPGDYNKFIH